MENESSIKQLITDSIKEIRNVIDADTIVGKPITTPQGTVIIPISRLSMGFASGGLDLPAGEGKSLGGAGGTGMTVTPVGFLTIDPEGKTEIIPMTPMELSPVDKVISLVDQAPDIINRVKGAIFGNKEEIPEDQSAREAEVADQLAQSYAEANPAEAPAEVAPEELSDKELREMKKAEKKAEKEAKKAQKKEQKEQKKQKKNENEVTREQIEEEIRLVRDEVSEADRLGEVNQ